MQKSFKNTLVRKKDSYELSLYQGELTTKGMSHAVATIKKAFPALDPNFYDVLLEMAKEQGMTDTRLMDSVKNTIINCQYPTPTVANFLSYDKKIKLYDYSDMLKMHQLDRNVFKIYRPIIIHGQNKPLWAHKCDIENYKKTSSI